MGLEALKALVLAGARQPIGWQGGKEVGSLPNTHRSAVAARVSFLSLNLTFGTKVFTPFL